MITFHRRQCTVLWLLFIIYCSCGITAFTYRFRSLSFFERRPRTSSSHKHFWTTKRGHLSKSSCDCSSNVEFEVRPVKRSDLEHVSSFCVDVFFPHLEDRAKRDEREACLNLLIDTHTSRNLYAQFVCESTTFVSHNKTHEKIIGFAEIAATNEYSYLSDAWILKVNALSVHSLFRNKGIGRKLVLCCTRQARNWGYGAIYIEVRTDNHDAIKFYEKIGFTKYEEIQFTKDACPCALMKLLL